MSFQEISEGGGGREAWGVFSDPKYFVADIGLIKLPGAYNPPPPGVPIPSKRFFMGPGTGINIDTVPVKNILTAGDIIHRVHILDRELRISGWGLDETEQMQQHLQVGFVNLTTNSYFVERTLEGVPVNMWFEQFTNGQWTCSGDSGGTCLI